MKNMFKYILASTACLAFVSLQMSIFVSKPFTQNSFEASSTIVSSGQFAETRITESGQTIQRLFTGVESQPFVDYLLVQDAKNGVSTLVPLRNTTSFFTDFIQQQEPVAFISSTLASEQKIATDQNFWIAILAVSLFAFARVYNIGALLFAALARVKNQWLHFRNLVFSTA